MRCSCMQLLNNDRTMEDYAVLDETCKKLANRFNPLYSMHISNADKSIRSQQQHHLLLLASNEVNLKKW